MQVSFESWVKACTMMRNQKGRLKSYTQWYPFSKLTVYDWEQLINKDYWRDYIKDNSFVLDKVLSFTTRGYIQKQGITLRDSYLVSPILYLYLLAYGIEFSKLVRIEGEDRIAYYAGNLDAKDPFYRKEYDSFCKSILNEKKRFSHCIITDISNFFSSITSDLLISDMISYSGGSFNVSDGLFIKALLEYCGHGKFPIIENHPTLSYLATVIYLYDIDMKVLNRVRGLFGVIAIRIVRYVDDAFIFVDIDDNVNPYEVMQYILQYYMDCLYEKRLIVNTDKTIVDKVQVVNERLSIISGRYFDEVHGLHPCAADPSNLVGFFNRLKQLASTNSLSEKSFEDAVSKYFVCGDSTTPPMASFRSCLFNEPEKFRDPDVIRSIDGLLRCGRLAFTYHTKEIIHCLLNTRNDSVIKEFLNRLFTSARMGTWSSLDLLAAITYLISRSVVHNQLIDCVKLADKQLGDYLSYFCMESCIIYPTDSHAEKLIEILKGDLTTKTQYLYSMSKGITGDYFEQACYYRAFFERFSSLAHSSAQGRHKKIKWIYKEKDFLNLYKKINNSKSVIKQSAMIRKHNPLIHADASLADDKNSDQIIKTNISDLQKLIEDYLDTLI